MILYLKEALEHDFSQLQAVGQALDGTVLVSKKGKMTIKTKNIPLPARYRLWLIIV